MIKYRATYSPEPEITQVEVERETLGTIWIDGRCRLKVTKHKAYFDTFPEAREHLIKVFTENRDHAMGIARIASMVLTLAKDLQPEQERKRV